MPEEYFDISQELPRTIEEVRAAEHAHYETKGIAKEEGQPWRERRFDPP